MDRVRVTEPVLLKDLVRVTDTVADVDASPPAWGSKQRRSSQKRRRVALVLVETLILVYIYSMESTLEK